MWCTGWSPTTVCMNWNWKKCNKRTIKWFYFYMATKHTGSVVVCRMRFKGDAIRFDDMCRQTLSKFDTYMRLLSNELVFKLNTLKLYPTINWIGLLGVTWGWTHFSGITRQQQQCVAYMGIWYVCGTRILFSFCQKTQFVVPLRDEAQHTFEHITMTSSNITNQKKARETQLWIRNKGNHCMRILQHRYSMFGEFHVNNGLQASPIEFHSLVSIVGSLLPPGLYALYQMREIVNSSCVNKPIPF